MTDTAHALVYVAPGRAELREVALPPMNDGMVEIRCLWSGISRGTERLVFEGRVPESEHERMRAPFQQGSFPFPVQYGYASTGRVEAGPEPLLGREVFVLHPHQTRFRVPVAAAVPLPQGLCPRRATLAANAETALNALWDARLRPGDRVAVVGAGLVGCLVAALLSLRGDLAVSVSDVIAERALTLADFSVTFRDPGSIPDDHRIVFHTSASAAGLATALDALRPEGEVIEMSWYGDRPVAVPLGRAFHARRLAIRCSQVGMVAPMRRVSTGYADRLARAMDLLSRPEFDRFITGECAFADLPARLPGLLAPGAEGIATAVKY